MDTAPAINQQDGLHQSPWVTFGINALDHPVARNLEPGRVYGLLTDLPSIRYPLLNSMVAGTLASGMPCTLTMATRPEHYLQQLCSPVRFDVNEAFDKRQLNVFVMQEEFQKKMFQIGIDRMLVELDRFGVELGSLVVFDHASVLLNMYDLAIATQQLDAVSAWAEARGHTVLMVFSEGQNANWINPRALLDSLHGISSLEDTPGGLQLRFPYWRFRDGVCSGLTFDIELDIGGEYRVREVRSEGTSYEGPELTGHSPAHFDVRVMPPREFGGRDLPPPARPLHNRNVRARRTGDNDFHLPN